MKNGEIWQDVKGNDIQAHGGCIMQFERKFYWYGEHKGIDNTPGQQRTDVIGVSCYSSDDLLNWTYEGLALSAENDENSMLNPKNVLERPKVIFNEKTKKYVMWAHVDSPDYVFAGAGVAVSDSPKGPFKFLGAIQPNRQDCRDMTLFIDDDKIAYLVHSTDWNKSLDIARLTNDYTQTDGFYVTVMRDQQREAPALCKHNGVYYMVTSGCSGWKPNSALYSTSEHILGQWKLIDNPCEGENYRKTFYGKSTYIFSVNGNDYLMLDHWKPSNLKKSGYSILPITYDENGIMIITWQDEWRGI